MFRITFCISTLVLFCCIVDCSGLNKSSLSIGLPIPFKGDDDCEVLLENFALASSNFTFCTIRFARPIKLCQYCVVKYKFVEDVHTDILTLEDEEGEECKAKLINLDRLQVVEAGFEYVTGLWTRAGCNNCFDVDDNGNPTKELNEKTKEILQLSNETQICIEKYRNNSYPNLHDPDVCFECKGYYLKLNARYDALKEEGFCMDIVDLMNTTRSTWSTNLGCCLDRKQPEWMFIVSSVVVTCLPVAFYLAAFLFASHKEQKLLKQRRLQENTTASTSSMK